MGLGTMIKEKLATKKRDKRLKKVSRNQDGKRLEYLIGKDTPFAVTEAFRNLKASLSVSVPKKEGGIALMTTSAYPKDGKTTVSVNLALMFAQSNVKVVVVDADIRKGRVAKFFGAKSAPGLTDYLSGQSSLEEVVHQSKVDPNLSYITCGTHSPKPYELLESAEMKNFLDKLRERYDYILLDTPPVLLVSDALALAEQVDGTIVVCRQQVSFTSDLTRAVNTLQFSKANILGVVVNDYKPTEAKSGKYSYNKYRYYNSYGYGYGYGRSEEKEEKEEKEEQKEK